MPKQVVPDWRIALSRPHVRQAVLSGKGLRKLDESERGVATELHRHITVDEDGKPLPHDERLRRMDLLSKRQSRASHSILVDHLLAEIDRFEFLTLSGHRIKYLRAFGPKHLLSVLKPLQVLPCGYFFTHEIRNHRPDIAIAVLRRWLEEAEAIASDPTAYPHARNTFSRDACRFRAEIKELKNRPTYVGRGRRSACSEATAREFVDRLTPWLASKAGLLKTKHRGPRGLAATEVQRQLEALGDELGVGVPTKEDVQHALLGGARPRTVAVRLAALALAASPATIKRLIKKAV